MRFDVWFSERSLHDSGAVERVARAARASAARPSSSDGALWLRTSAHGDDKDRVLVRSTGEHTYFTSDIAYLEDKRERGFERLIYVWGADHHGYIARMRAVCEALGGDRDSVEIVIQQFVHLIGAEGRTAMSKREGEYVTLDELVDEIGVDAARFFLLARSHDTTVDLDLDLARAPERATTRSTTCSTRTRGSRRCWRARARTRVAEALRERRTPSSRCTRPSARCSSGSSRSPTSSQEAADRRAPHRVDRLRARARAGLHRVLPRLPRRRRRAARRPSRCGSRSRSRRSGRSRRRSRCSASARPTQM